MDERGLMHAFSGKNNCSVRTQLSKKIVDKTISVFKKVKVSKIQTTHTTCIRSIQNTLAVVYEYR